LNRSADKGFIAINIKGKTKRTLRSYINAGRQLETHLVPKYLNKYK